MFPVSSRAWRVAAALMLFAAGGCSRTSSSMGAPDFADLVEAVNPSVVNISAVADAPAPPQTTLNSPDGSDAGKDADSEKLPEWFKKYFADHAGDQNNGQDNGQDDGSTDMQSLGSGFVLWSDGYILTNYHVVKDAREVVVRLLDRRQFTAKVVGSDEPSDLALLKINASDLPAVTLGNSRKLRPGQWVLAIGSPFGFDYSVTAGIVSAKGRALETEQYVPFIQTDVAINPGNSGGPLFNLKGEVVGVNSQIYSQSGGYEGLSFAIPINIAAKVAAQLKARGHVTRGWLGVVVQEVDRATAQALGMDKPEGALVARVVGGSPGEQAGIKAGDVILSYNGEELPSSTALPPLVGSTDPGQIVTLQVMREHKNITIKVEVGTLNGQQDSVIADAPAPASIGPLGLAVQPLTPDKRREAQVVSGGVLVMNVVDGPALRAGVRVGDILLQINGQQVDTPDRLAVVASRLTPGVSVQVLVQRRGSPLFLTMDVPAAAAP
ncbi:MAG: Do family serine endopeptidase [Stenotrophobium sp.]